MITPEHIMLFLYAQLSFLIAAHKAEDAWPLFRPHGVFGRLSGVLVVFVYHLLFWPLRPIYQLCRWILRRINTLL